MLNAGWRAFLSLLYKFMPSLSLILLLSTRAFGDFDFYQTDKQSSPPDEYLQEKGYTLNAEAFHSILASEHEVLEKLACLEYIKKAQLREMKNDVAGLIDRLEEKSASLKKQLARSDLNSVEKRDIETRIQGIRTLWEPLLMQGIDTAFAIEPDMAVSTKERFMKTIRSTLYEPRLDSSGPTGFALSALVSAHKYQTIDIKGDLVFLSKIDVLKDMRHIAVRGLFYYYSSQLTDKEIREIYDSAKTDVNIQALVVGECAKHGIHVQGVAQ